MQRDTSPSESQNFAESACRALSPLPIFQIAPSIVKLDREIRECCGNNKVMPFVRWQHPIVVYVCEATLGPCGVREKNVRPKNWHDIFVKSFMTQVRRSAVLAGGGARASKDLPQYKQVHLRT